MAEGGPEERVAQEAPVQTASFGSLIVLAVAGPFVGPAASALAPTLVARDGGGA